MDRHRPRGMRTGTKDKGTDVNLTTSRMATVVLAVILWAHRLDAQAGAFPGRRVVAPAAFPAGRKPLVLVQYDMEGLSGQTDWRTQEYRFSFIAGQMYELVAKRGIKPIYPEIWAQGQALLAADVNAVVDGLFAAGAGAVDVIDKHGSGSPEVDLPPDKLDRRARHLLPKQVAEIKRSQHDAVVLVAQHVSTGTFGFSPHTGNPGTMIRMNGMSITETDLFTFTWGDLGFPVILVSGDDQLGIDVKNKTPWVEYVSVKQAVGPDSALLRPVADAHDDLRRGARRALENRAQWRVVTLKGPIDVTTCAIPPASMELLAGLPATEYRDGCLFFRSSTFDNAWRSTRTVINLAAASGYNWILLSTILEEPRGLELLDRINENVGKVWFETEKKRISR